MPKVPAPLTSLQLDHPLGPLPQTTPFSSSHWGGLLSISTLPYNFKRAPLRPHPTGNQQTIPIRCIQLALEKVMLVKTGCTLHCVSVSLVSMSGCTMFQSILVHNVAAFGCWSIFIVPSPPIEVDQAVDTHTTRALGPLLECYSWRGSSLL